MMNTELTEIRIKGKDINVPSIQVEGSHLISCGRWLKTARLFDEELVERRRLPDPERLISALQKSTLAPDLFSFAQRPPDLSTRYPYRAEWDNWAIAPTRSFSEWWDALPQESRKNARQAEKRGVIVNTVTFDDDLVRGIKGIYDETPFRQGKPFWHYGKSFEAVKKENSTYLDRSLFVGAYVENCLIGFIKIIRVDELAVVIQILATAEHRDRKPMNAMLRHTVQLCEREGLESLVYGQYHYGTNNDSSLTEFKRRNGFTEVKFPRYLVPLTRKGNLALSTGLHLGWKNLLPTRARTFLIKVRGKVLKTRKQ